MVLSAGLACIMGAWTAAAAGPVTDPGATMRWIAAQPFRYGGALQGVVPGAAGAIDQPPVHLSIGLGAPDSTGRIQGKAILFTADRHLVALGPVDGRIVAGSMPGIGSGSGCTLRMMLADRTVTLSGSCSARALSGEIVSRASRVGGLARLVSWWGEDPVSGRYWLTPESFDPASS